MNFPRLYLNPVLTGIFTFFFSEKAIYISKHIRNSFLFKDYINHLLPLLKEIPKIPKMHNCWLEIAVASIIQNVNNLFLKVECFA